MVTTAHATTHPNAPHLLSRHSACAANCAVAGLLFNVWLAMVAYQKDPEVSPTAGSQEGITDTVSTVATDPLEYLPSSVFMLKTIGALEGAAAAGLYYQHIRYRSTAGRSVGRETYWGTGVNHEVSATPTMKDALA